MTTNKFQRAFGGWHVSRDFYGDAVLTEATLIPKKEKFYLGVGLNINFEGNYQLRLTDKSFRETGKYILFLAKWSTSLITLKEVMVDPEQYHIDMGGPVTIRLEMKNGVLHGSLNDELLLTYDDSGSKQPYRDGFCGIWIHPEQGADIKDFRCDGKQKPMPVRKPQSRTDKRYDMCFAEADPVGRLPGWSTQPGEREWHVQNGMYCSPKDGESSLTHLHVFEREPHMQMDVTFDFSGNRGACGVLIRHAPETAYVKAGYNNAVKKWFLEDVPALYDCRIQRFESEPYIIERGKCYHIELCVQEACIVLKVDNKIVLDAENVRQTGFGRIGLFTEKMDMCISSFHVDTPYATDVIDGVVKTYVDKNHIGASTEIEVTPDGSLVGVAKVMFDDTGQPYRTGVYHSVDKGMSFHEVKPGEAYSGLDTKGMYQSIHRLKNGRYLQVLLAEDLLVQASEDMVQWEDIGRIQAMGKYRDYRKIFHVASLTEFVEANGHHRVFMPITMSKTVMLPTNKLVTMIHDTVVFYSDDEGRHWTQSKVSTADVLEKEGHAELLSYAECKLVQCADGSLRLYNSRNDTRFVCYSESFDFGETWEGFHAIRKMQCAKSSSAFREDPTEPGTYYMAWVNDEPLIRGNCNGRTRLSLARSRDGKTWNYLGDAEYMSLRFADEMPHLYIPLFQILDPSITVVKDYVYLTYGISMYSAKDAKPGDAKMVHHIQRPAMVRFKKSALREQPWDAASICNPELMYESEEDIL